MSGSNWRCVPHNFLYLTILNLTLHYRHERRLTFDRQLSNVTERIPVAQQELLSGAGEIIEALIVRAEDKEFKRAAAKKTLLKDAGSVSILFSYCHLAPLIYVIHPQDDIHTVRQMSGQAIATRGKDDLLASLCPNTISSALGLQEGDVVFLARRSRLPEVRRIFCVG